LGSHFTKKSNSKNKKFNKEVILKVSVARSVRDVGGKKKEKKKRQFIYYLVFIIVAKNIEG
jgi:hypothetical protein